MSKPAEPVLMWAAINLARPKDGRSREWIHINSIRRTRREARRAYLDLWNPEYESRALSWVRFARVVVSVAGEKAR